MIDVRENVRDFIFEKGFKQAAIAQKARLTPAKLSGIMNLNRKLEVNEFFSICDALGVTPDELRDYRATKT